MQLKRSSTSDKWRCLVVDDEDELREILSEYVADLPADFEIDTATDGEIALELCNTNYYDLIICDIKMPNLNGIQFLKELRKKRVTSAFVIITAYGDRDSILDALRSGAYDFIFKPFSYDQVAASLSGLLDFLQHKASVEGQIRFILKDQGMSEKLIQEVFEFNESILKERYATLSKQMQNIA